MNTQILWINATDMIIYSTGGVSICQDKEKFNSMVLEEKRKIANRDYILNRFEPWEVESLSNLRMLLVARSRNAQEKNLVLSYMKHLNKENV